MADYNKVSIGSIFLTDDGTETGLPCRVEVTGLDRLKPTKTGAVQIAADGTPKAFITGNTGRGVLISIRPTAVMKDVFDDVNDAINDALGVPETINITIDGDTGTFDLDCVPSLPQPIEFPGTFASEQIDDVRWSFIVSAVN